MRRRPGIGGLQTAAAARVTTVSSVGLIHRFPFGYLLMLNINSFRVFAFHFLKWY
jgi:hypothetical protein